MIQKHIPQGSGAAMTLAATEPDPRRRVSQRIRGMYEQRRRRRDPMSRLICRAMLACYRVLRFLEPWLIPAAILSLSMRLGELQDIDRLDVVARLDKAVDQAVLRNLLAWQLHLITRTSGMPRICQFNLILKLKSGRDDPRIADLLSLACLSCHTCSISLYYDGGAADEVPSTMVDVAPGRRLARADEPDLDSVSATVLGKPEIYGRGGIFQLPVGMRKKLNDFMKAIAPGDFSVALSLTESPDGTASEHELSTWLPVLQRLRSAYPLTFCLLNRVPDVSVRDWPSCLRPLRSLDFSFAETVGVAHYAQFYMGVLDVCGLAALAAERPGVYWPLDASIYTDSDISSGATRVSDDNVETIRPDTVRFSSSVSPTQAAEVLIRAIAKSGVIAFGPRH
jgi:hypothetical protein